MGLLSFSSFSAFSNWRMLYILTIPLRFFFSLQSSYIHPDEYYQTFNPIYYYIIGDKSIDLPWEFSSVSNPARSFIPLYIFYIPIIYICENWFHLSPAVTYQICRLFLCYLSWFVTDIALYNILPIKQERVKALFFNSLSYISIVYQNHTFSNSIETIILLSTLLIITKLRQFLEQSSSSPSIDITYHDLLNLSYLLAIGIFNRITFIAWLILPSYYILKFIIRQPLKGLYLISMTLLLCIGCIIIDTITYHPISNSPLSSYTNNLFNLKSYTIPNILEIVQEFKETITNHVTITPLNNLIYNSDLKNLEKHGIHSRFTHLLINYPLIVGPLILLLFPFHFKYTTTLPFLSFLSGMLTLSTIPHQELRFLQPIVPLVSCCVLLPSNSIEDDEEFNKKMEFLNTLQTHISNDQDSKYIEIEKNKNHFINQKLKSINFKKLIIDNIIICFIVFNLLMCIIQGYFHQAGVFPATELVSELLTTKETETYPELTTIVYWRTYKPPTWLLHHHQQQNTESNINRYYFNKDENDLVKDINFDEIMKNSSGLQNQVIVDCMGLQIDKLIELNNKLITDPSSSSASSQIQKKNNIFFIAPTNSMLYFTPIIENASFKINDSKLNSSKTSFKFIEIEKFYNIDMDHFEFNEYGFKTFIPYLSVYSLIENP